MEKWAFLRLTLQRQTGVTHRRATAVRLFRFRRLLKKSSSDGDCDQKKVSSGDSDGDQKKFRVVTVTVTKNFSGGD